MRLKAFVAITTVL